MKKIVIHYWISKLSNLSYENGEEFEYSEENQNGIICTILNAGYNIMLQQVKETETLIIWIDNKRFQQR